MDPWMILLMIIACIGGLVLLAAAIFLFAVGWWAIIPYIGAMTLGWFGFLLGLGIDVIIGIIWLGIKEANN